MQIADLELGLPYGELPDERTEPSTWTRYTGTFDDPYWLGTFTVALEGERLWTTFDDGTRAELVQYGRDEFTMVFGETSQLDATFFLDANGNAEYLATRGGTGRRVE